MRAKTVSQNPIIAAFKQKVNDYKMLFKFRLAMLVVFSAVMAYLIALEGAVNWVGVIVLSLGGFLITAAANTLNQVLERDYDKLMKRTENRPLAQGRISVSNAVMTAGFLTLIGITLLALFNPWTALLGTISLVTYAFVYTPMKRVSPLAVTIGAIPGALPTAIGVVAVEGEISALAIALFAIQFFWQFPHFWAIAWVGNEDYTKAGFKLLPTQNGELTSNVGLQSFLYALMLLLVTWLPYQLGATGIISAIILTLLGIIYAWYSWDFYKKCTRASALKLMFCSFFYLPIALIVLFLDKI